MHSSRAGVEPSQATVCNHAVGGWVLYSSTGGGETLTTCFKSGTGSMFSSFVSISPSKACRAVSYRGPYCTGNTSCKSTTSSDHCRSQRAPRFCRVPPDLEEIRPLHWVFQQALDQCNKGGFYRFHLSIPVLTQTGLTSTEDRFSLFICQRCSIHLLTSGFVEVIGNLSKQLWTAWESTEPRPEPLQSSKISCNGREKVNLQQALLWRSSFPHPGSQTQDQLGSLSAVHQSRNRLSHRKHKLLEFVIIRHVFLLSQLPHGSREKLQWRHQEAKRGKWDAWLCNTSVMARGERTGAPMSHILAINTNQSVRLLYLTADFKKQWYAPAFVIF